MLTMTKWSHSKDAHRAFLFSRHLRIIWRLPARHTITHAHTHTHTHTLTLTITFTLTLTLALTLTHMRSCTSDI